MSPRARAVVDPKAIALEAGVERIERELAGAEASACLVLAEALYAWILHDGHAEALEAALSKSLHGLGEQQAPLFASLHLLPMRMGLAAVPELARDLGALFSRHAWSWADGELLGALFEGSLHQSHRKRHGAFYTPHAIVDHVLELSLPPADRPLPKDYRLLDPSCGAGNFLARAAEALFERVWVQQTGAEGRYLRLQRVFNHHLWGLDLNPWALKLAQIRLAFLQHHLVPGLALPLRAQLTGMDTLQDHAPQLEPGFDAVVGNPPYGAELADEAKRFFSIHYRLGQGRQDTTALFVERSARLLRSGGRLGLVVPHGVTRTGAYAACRRLLVEDLRLRALADLGAAFPGVNLETIAFVAERPAPVGQRGAMPWARLHADEVQLDSFRDGERVRVGTQSQAFYRGRATMPIYVDAANAGWIAKVEAEGVPLQEIASIRRGAGLSAKEPAIALRSEGVSVVRGRDIKRFGDAGGWLRLHSDYPLRDRFRREVLAEPRVGYQNIASSVVATLLPAGSLPLDTVNLLEPVSALEPDLLLALMNSRLLEAYFQLAIANRGQLTLHLDTPTLGTLPLALPSGETARRLTEASARARAALEGAGAWDLAMHLEAEYWDTPEALMRAAKAWQAGQQEAKERAEAAIAEVDREVYALYGLTDSEVAAVEAATPRGPRRGEAPKKRLSVAAELVIARGCLRVLATSDRPREAVDLWRSWPRPDAEAFREAWGGDPAEDLSEMLVRYGAVARGRRLEVWHTALEPIR